ncbi:hypothetical protein J1N35_043755 [Gossypium stocksii]|uniref:Uncharacterized protein n=1 Tax=Gossypium stocksii TaxID=47602 RepID=A0A9D3ZFD6_9ROSI|nr:hypothetical protein J1N35_043755 [Gossypium stocksii]
MARICQVAETLNWELFCEKRPKVDEELVRQFYANLTSSELTEVPVHGIKELTVPGFKWTVSKQGIHTCRREYLTPLAKPEQSAKVPDAEPMELEAEPDIETSMFGPLTPSPDLQDELSKLMDIMQLMQWQQQAY